MPARPARRRPRGLYTAEAATRTLPLLGRIAADIVPLARRLADRRARLSWVANGRGGRRAAADGPHADELRESERVAEADAERLDGLVAEVRALGAAVRDVNTGLVEFPGVRDGRDGFYSWRPGESAVTHWRPAAGDPTDRSPLRPAAALAPLVDPGEPADAPDLAGL